jgi:hypothetical protein
LIGVLLLLAAVSCGEARLLFLEDPLRSFPPFGPGARRLEIGSEFFGAAGWTGLRHTFRLDGQRGERLGWSITLPWLYSSYLAPSNSGRDNFRFGGSLRVSGSKDRHFSLLGESWMPFTEDDLYPLGQRRAFCRLALVGGLRLAAYKLRGGVAYRWELKGIGPDTFDDGWPNRYSAFFELGRRLSDRLEGRCEGGISVSDEAATWSRLGGVLAFDWSEFWRAELGFEGTLGNQSDPDLYDYRVSFRVLREFPRPPEMLPGERAGETGDAPADPVEATEEAPADPGEAAGEAADEEGAPDESAPPG